MMGTPVLRPVANVPPAIIMGVAIPHPGFIICVSVILYANDDVRSWAP